MATAYLDESKDGQEKRTFVLAGYFGRDENWELLWTKWARLLKTFAIPEFHASDCEKGSKRFFGMSEKRRAAIQREFIRLLSGSESGLFGHLSAIQLEPYIRLRPRFKKARKIPRGLAISGSLDDPYYLGLQIAVERIARRVDALALPPEEKIEFIFDESALGGRVPALFDSIKNAKNLGAWTSRLGGVQLRSSAECLPLQAADLWAYEAFRFSEQRFAGEATKQRWQYTALERSVDWNSSSYFDETGLLKVLEVFEGSGATDQNLSGNAVQC